MFIPSLIIMYLIGIKCTFIRPEVSIKKYELYSGPIQLILFAL